MKIKLYLFGELHENSTAFRTCLIAPHRNVHMRATKFNIPAQFTAYFTTQLNIG